MTTLDLTTLSNDDLRDAMNVAHADLAAAVREQPESEWHQVCFAATVLLAQEVNRRGLTPIYTH